MDKLLRIGDKVFHVLQKKCRKLDDAYMVALLVVIFFEECEGVRINPEGLENLHTFVREAWADKSVP
jgi:hypothetical protein